MSKFEPIRIGHRQDLVLYADRVTGRGFVLDFKFTPKGTILPAVSGVSFNPQQIEGFQKLLEIADLLGLSLGEVKEAAKALALLVQQEKDA